MTPRKREDGPVKAAFATTALPLFAENRNTFGGETGTGDDVGVRDGAWTEERAAHEFDRLAHLLLAMSASIRAEVA